MGSEDLALPGLTPLHTVKMSPLLVMMVMFAGQAMAQLNIDLSRAEIDPNTGNFCVMQKVCIANPPDALTSAGCAPQFPPGCDCDSEAADPDSTCSNNFMCVQCKCLPPGCNCDPNAADPDGFCPVGEVCKDCVCQPPFPPGCNCDPFAADADSVCSIGEVCKDCVCQPPFPPGCNCDPFAADADSVCSIGEVCKDCLCQPPFPPGCNCDPFAPDADSVCFIGEVCRDCLCQPPFPPGCDCDPDIPNADAFCPGDLRCVGCNCQDCPASNPGGKVLNPPLVFVIDTTKSVKPDKDSIFNLTMKVVDTIRKDKINIPRYQLVTFNDFGPAINRNVRLEIDTNDVIAFGRKTANLKFESYNGGRDSKERLTQGLLVALQNSSPKSLIVVFTDNGSKDLGLEKEIVRLRERNECEVYIVLTPEYEGRANGKSLPVYNRLGKVFEISQVGADSFLQKVEEFEEGNCL